MLTGCLAITWTPATAADRLPNIVVIFTDDQGYADLGAQGVVDDIQTPHLDQFASQGVRCTAGYITAPQCSPSRAGLVTGRYQQRFGMDSIPDCPLPLEEQTIAELLAPSGYTSGMVGKWHLNPNAVSLKWAQRHLPGAVTNNSRVRIPGDVSLKFYPHAQGFNEYFVGEHQRYFANFGTDTSDLSPEGEWVNDPRYRIDVQTDAAVAFVERNAERPFFLYVGYYAPHVPLEATEKYLSRFPGEMPERRRYALAMMSAVDDGVGRIMETVEERGIDEQTLFVYISDNGAPLRLTKKDERPIDKVDAGWDGSLNDPFVGEKGMLSEGGIRVPFLVRWKGALPAGSVYDQPVISLDVAATALAIAGLEQPPQLDGVNLLPYLTGDNIEPPHGALFWRFWSQAAVRSGRWKYLTVGDAAEFLFDMHSDATESQNLLDQQPEIANQLRAKLASWTSELQPAGIPTTPANNQEVAWYRHHLGADVSESSTPVERQAKATPAR